MSFSFLISQLKSNVKLKLVQMAIQRVLKLQIVSLERILIVILAHARVIIPTYGTRLLLLVIVLLHIIMTQQEEPVVILFRVFSEFLK
jgi:hypothetical protein